MSNCRAIGLGLLALAACGDPELTVRFTVPDPFRAELASADVRILEPPDVDHFGCEDLAFGRVAPELVRVSRVLELSALPDEIAPLADVDRMKPKLFVAEGRTRDGARLVTGCAELGSIDADTTLEIRAEPVPEIVPGPLPAITFTPGGPSRGRVQLGLRDKKGRAQPGVAAHWEVVGAANSGSNGAAQSDAEGKISIDLASPGQPGPFVLVVRVRWAEGDPVVVSGAVAPTREQISLPGRAREAVVGHIGANGELGIAALTLSGGVARVELAIRSGQGFAYESSGALSPAATLTLLGGKGRGPDRVLVVSPDEWTEVHPDGTTQRRQFTPPVPGLYPESLLPAELCDGSGPLVLVNFDDGTPAVFDETGRKIEHALEGANVRAVASGCVATQDQRLSRTILLAVPDAFGLLVYTQPDLRTFQLGTWIALSFGVAFAPAPIGSQPVMVGTQINVDDIAISRATLELGPLLTPYGDVAVVNRGLDLVPLTPQVTAAGELDGDGRLDLAAILIQPKNQGDPERSIVWTILGRETAGKRIAGPLLSGVDLQQPALYLADFDGNQIDDVVLVERPAGLGLTSSRVEILRLGTP